MKNKKKNRYLLLLILLLAISIGYAALSTTLKINGSATVTKNTWSVYWANPQVTTGSVTTTAPTLSAESGQTLNTIATWSTTLNLPGDFYEFTIDAVNNGSIDAMITGIQNTVSPALESYIKYTVTYDDGVAIAENHLLPKKTGNTATVQKYKVRVEFLDTITPTQMNAIPEGGLSYTFNYHITYSQATDAAIQKPEFALGNYFTLVPDAAQATTTTAGFSGSTPTADQTLWRVISINDDGTYDAVSEYASTNTFTISGTDGYKNYVAGLQDIASKYSKSGYTVGTRMMGYDGQTAVISDTSAFDGTNTDAPSPTSTPSPTTGTGEEYSGGVLGDTLYLKDYQLVSSVYSSDTATYGSVGLKAYDKAGTVKRYWLASRSYIYTLGGNRFVFGSRDVESGTPLRSSIRTYAFSEWEDSTYSYSVRPIITLKSGVKKATGDGSKTDPYTFE